MRTQEMLEIERIKNLVTSFGWELIKQESPQDYIIVTLRKPRKSVNLESD